MVRMPDQYKQLYQSVNANARAVAFRVFRFLVAAESKSMHQLSFDLIRQNWRLSTTL